MDLNNRVQKIIEYSLFTASEFADEIGVQRSNISHILSGRNKPSLDFLMKIKDRFPEIEWEWMIEGKGEMTISPFKNVQSSKINFEEEEEKNTSPTSNLLGLIKSSTLQSQSDETLQTVKENHNNLREFNIPNQDQEKENINDSQLLENKEIPLKPQNTENHENEIKKIIFFYENGKFEIFEP